MRRGTALWALVLSVSCGGGGAPAHSAEDAPKEEPAAGEPSGTEAGDTKKDEAPKEEEKAKEAETPAAEPLSSADLAKALETFLADPELGAYLQKSSRGGVKVSGPDLPKDLKVVQGTHYAQIVDGPKGPKDPVVVITRLAHDGDVVTIAYRYDVDGIVGTTRVKNGKSGWELMSSRIVEH
ncbi:MAG TPA: hypothetical protein VHE30_04055 [Polyangiaceae bacterium]|nr:hypothetical protein [Polyangiaceae bacterium]